ncbi:MAG: FAD-dependent oxidoreductase [Clostridia bacterium]|nr:FAD-dependent oxidoreductase [Clostridia bacterium]
MVRISNIKIKADYDEEELFDYICKKFNINKNSVGKKRIVKKSIDARNKKDIFYNYAVEIECSNEEKIKGAVKIKESPEQNINVKRKSNVSPVIVGAGPAGLFAALTFVQNGIKPIVIEQGKCVQDRKKDVDEFLKTGKLDVLSNVQFGEGGAGTFSDGKLTSGIHDPLCKKVLQEFYNFGAPEQILNLNKPHIGTDNLIKIIENMRNYIIEHGGTFLFNEKVVDFEIQDSKICAVVCESGKRFATDSVILAIGHSARTTFEKLYEKGVHMEKKNFSVGVRIEHKQEMINKSQYGDETKLKLPPAEYKLAYHGEDRSCYTFCMCPGGTVIASSSEENTIVTNGMSKFARDGENANSAVLVNIMADDFQGNSPLEGMYFQKDLEEKAFYLGGANYKAPIQRYEDFKANRKSTYIGSVKPTYMPGVTLSNLNEILPDFVSKTLVEGIEHFDKLISGFANPDSILTGVETRSSSPVQITRDENKESNVKGVYPCGEGAGYAGGIMSAAVDGIKCAIAILEKKQL